VTGCLLSGQVTTVVSFGNMYRIEFGIDNCNGQDAVWNGSTFEGLATLDDRSGSDILLYAVNGEMGGEPVSVVALQERL
jgi:hypothetical protein